MITFVENVSGIYFTLICRFYHSRFKITGSKFCIESYPLVASSQHVGASAAVTILQLEFMLVEQ